MLTIEDFINAANMYTITHTFLPGREHARIYPKSRLIRIDPDYKEDGLSLVHEIYHHHYDSIGRNTIEFIIEQEAQEFYFEHKLVVDSYVRYRLCPTDC